MTVITTKLMVSTDGSVSLADAIPAGEHTVWVDLQAPYKQAKLDYQSFPKIDLGPWPDGLSLRREDIRRRRPVTVADTNVLVHATVTTSPDHGRAFAALDRAAIVGQVSITRQVLREYVAVLTRPQTWAAAALYPVAMELAEALAARFPVLEDGPEVWARLRQLAGSHQFGGKQVHDANIVATMLAYGHTRLLTFNLGDFRRYQPVIEVVPA